jgi:hypothetical protein
LATKFTVEIDKQEKPISIMVYIAAKKYDKNEKVKINQSYEVLSGICVELKKKEAFHNTQRKS